MGARCGWARMRCGCGARGAVRASYALEHKGELVLVEIAHGKELASFRGVALESIVVRKGLRSVNLIHFVALAVAPVGAEADAEVAIGRLVAHPRVGPERAALDHRADRGGVEAQPRQRVGAYRRHEKSVRGAVVVDARERNVDEVRLGRQQAHVVAVPRFRCDAFGEPAHVVGVEARVGTRGGSSRSMHSQAS